MPPPIRVGVIGANSDKGWASITHLPALHALESFDLTAVCTTRQNSADAAAARYGARHSVSDAATLVGLPDVDLVVVSVRAPQHDRNVRLALDAGKHVLCEWPLGIDSAQSAALLVLARQRGIRHFVGLQGHASPAMIRARQLLAEGYVGDLLSVAMRGALQGWGPATPVGSEYIFDAQNGVTVASIPGGHSVDMVCSLIGEITSVAGLTVNRRRHIAAPDGLTLLDKTSPDQFLFTAQTSSGVPISVHIQGGARERETFTIEIRGTKGTLRLEADAIPEIIPHVLFGTQDGGGVLRELPIPALCRSAPPGLTGVAVNVAQVYADIASDLHHGTSIAPDFARALKRRLLIDSVARSGDEGRWIDLFS